MFRRTTTSKNDCNFNYGEMRLTILFVFTVDYFRAESKETINLQ